jgi:hypothetical protein
MRASARNLLVAEVLDLMDAVEQLADVEPLDHSAANSGRPRQACATKPLKVDRANGPPRRRFIFLGQR